MKFSHKRQHHRGAARKKNNRKNREIILRISESDFDLLQLQASQARFPSLSEYALFVFLMSLRCDLKLPE